MNTIIRRSLALTGCSCALTTLIWSATIQVRATEDAETGPAWGNRETRLVTPPNPNPDGLVWLSPGTFIMGSPAEETDRYDDEGPRHRVTIRHGFWMAKTEVTQRQYEALMKSNPSRSGQGPDLPVEHVSWRDATNYCARLTTREREAGRLPSGFVYRLPSETEWEYAARCGTPNRFSHGDDPRYVALTNHAWFFANSQMRTQPVGSKTPNAWGLCDLSGNVAEWCLDFYAPRYSGQAAANPASPGQPTTSPEAYRVFRGGSWEGGPHRCRSAARQFVWANYRAGLLGFRVVLAPPVPSEP